MRTLTRLLLLALVAHAAALAAPAGAQSQDNTAVAVNKKDGKSVFKLAFSVKKVTGDVDAANTAVAYASCTDCKTVAAAIQVVLVSDPGAVTPENTAIAINYECSECETLAAAYQFVYGDGQELAFTKEGKQRLHDLKKRFQDLKHRDDLTLDQLADEIAAIAAEVAVVVDTEVEVKKATDAAAETTTSTSSTAPPGPSSTTSSVPASTTSSSSSSTSTSSPSTTTSSTTTTTAVP
jgi:putative peptide zinc metalloprotease protein